MSIESLNKFYTKAYENKIDTSEKLLAPPNKSFTAFVSNNKGKTKNFRAIDLGYGYGNYSLFLANNNYLVTSVDIVPSTIFKKRIKANYKEHIKKINVICADLNKFNIIDEYDLVISLNTLHYLEVKQFNRLILQSAKNTKKGGKNYFEIFTDINRFGNIDPYLKKRKNLTFQYVEGFFSKVYDDWLYEIKKENYSEKTEDYKFQAKKLIFKGEKL